MSIPRSVRFASQDDYRTYDVMTPEPSPSFSTSTLESDDGPFTPPRPTHPFLETHSTSPASYTFVQAENHPSSIPKGHEGVTLNNVLIPSVQSTRGMELWKDNYLFQRQLESFGIPSHVLDDPATVPPLNEMIVTCNEYLPGRELHIRPSSSSSTAPVTVRDVFMRIHKELWKRVSRKEYDELSPNRKPYVTAAYTRRYNGVTGGPVVVSQEKNDGVKLVDLLPDPQRFAGLYPTNSPRHWTLVLDIRPPQPYPRQ
ncbi:hypothetical protein BDQ17DRAFT_1544679 [Cyathus striatus]|nr:hypothetical protein BDQ17DRAFT_1544679 [Cyathus striatus]